MGHMIHNHQMLDMAPEQGLCQPHPNPHIPLGNSVNYRNESIPPVLPAPGNSPDPHFQCTDPYGTNWVHGSHFNGMQYCLSASKNYVGEVALGNFNDPHMPSSSNVLVKSISSSINFQTVPSFSYHHNYSVQTNQMNQSFQPSGNAFMEVLGNFVVDGRYSNQNYTNATTYMHGMCLNSWPLESADMGIRGYQGNSAFNMHHPSFSNTSQNYLHVQNFQVNVYSHHTQTLAAPYWHPFNNLHANNVHPVRDDQRSGFGHVGPMSFTSRPMDDPPIFEAVPGTSYDPRNPPFEDAAELTWTEQFYDSEDDFDQDSDMRMDIDGMSHEELMELEDNIGDVKTGLSDEFILKNLRTSMHVQESKSSSLGSLSQSASENEICVICQVEYEENERIGTLDCGHSYHADCIKQWLAVKNSCPICKASAYGGW